jgi:hypothetical protein
MKNICFHVADGVAARLLRAAGLLLCCFYLVPVMNAQPARPMPRPNSKPPPSAAAASGAPRPFSNASPASNRSSPVSPAARRPIPVTRRFAPATPAMPKSSSSNSIRRSSPTKNCWKFFGKRTTRRRSTARAMTRHAISFHYSLQRRGAEGGGGKIQGRGRPAFLLAHRDANRAADEVLFRRRVSPELLQPAFQPRLLPICHRAEVAQTDCQRGHPAGQIAQCGDNTRFI